MREDRILELKEVQRRILSIMTEVDKVCEKNHIPYFLIFGSMLGAVRHKGFIPWDDDIDIAIPRPYYDQFLQVAIKQLPSFLRVVSHKTSSSYIYSFIKVEDRRTEIEFSWTKNCGLQEGLYIDVFVLDGLPRNVIWRKCYCYFVRKLNSFNRALHQNEDQRPIIKRIIAKIIKRMFFIKKQTLLYFIDRQMKRYEYSYSDYAANYNTIDSSGIIKKKTLGTPKKYCFENTMFYGVDDYHTYLTEIYGDYMKLPPEEQRRSHSLKVRIKEHE